jgi:uncharacterized protein (UPF0335 family)
MKNTKLKSKRASVTQNDLQAIESLRREKSRLASSLKNVEATLAQREREVMDALSDSARIQAGALRPFIDKKTVCSPSYKDELVAHFEQSHGIDAKIVEQQVRARWTTVKEVLGIAHVPVIKSVH